MNSTHTTAIQITDVKALSSRLDNYIVETMRLLVLHEDALFPSQEHAPPVDNLKKTLTLRKGQADVCMIWSLAVQVHGTAAGLRKERNAQRAVVRFYENYLNVRLNGLLTYATEIRLWLTADVIEGLSVSLLKSVRKRIEIVRELDRLRSEVSERLSFELKT